MAVEQPHAGIIRPKSHDDMPIRPHQQNISPHRLSRQHKTTIRDTFRIEIPAIVVTTRNGLENMPMQMERMFSRVLVIDHDLDDFVVLEHVGVRVDTIDFCVGGQVASCQGGIKRGNFRADIGDAVEERVVLITRC